MVDSDCHDGEGGGVGLFSNIFESWLACIVGRGGKGLLDVWEQVAYIDCASRLHFVRNASFIYEHITFQEILRDVG